ncbi:hypothetical protein BDV96DRAFT_459774, partial [Lophiotrema nucula]
PRTIQDAIKITHELGFDYLWVDSLCIIQDDAVEIAQEIALMPLIYSNAVVTIAASSARAVTDGFLGHDTIFDGPATRLSTIEPDGTPGCVFAVLIPDGGDPLHCRGWALQEALSSTRLLDYGTRQLRFSCSVVLYNDEGFRDGWTRSATYFGWDIHPVLDLFSRGTENRIQLWHNMVQKYTDRRLSIPADRSLGISSIASIISSKIPQDEYIAGHWKSNLPEDLLWSVREQVQRPKTFQGPSWSWTGVNGPIGLNYALPRFAPRRAKVISTTNVLVEQSAPFSAVKAATLVLR